MNRPAPIPASRMPRTAKEAGGGMGRAIYKGWIWEFKHSRKTVFGKRGGHYHPVCEVRTK